jgi:hypothetical protein
MLKNTNLLITRYIYKITPFGRLIVSLSPKMSPRTEENTPDKIVIKYNILKETKLSSDYIFHKKE